MADISHLTGLQNSGQLSDDTYADVDTTPRGLPVPGRYTLQAPERFSGEMFAVSRDGFLQARIDPTIVGGERDGYTLRYTRISSKVFDRNGVPASFFGDYLRACGQTADLTGDPQELADAVEETAGATFEADVDWELYARGHGPDGSDLSIRGMRKFPQNPDGSYASVIESETETDPRTNRPKLLFANLRVRRFIPAE